MDGKDVLSEYKAVIERSLQSVHKQFAAILRDWPMNFIAVVVVKGPNFAPDLYRTDGSVMLQERQYVAFGTGKLICDYFSQRLYQYPRLDKPNLMAVAAFIFREAHQSASGVGEDVDMVYITRQPDPRPGVVSLAKRQTIPPDYVREIQKGIPPLAEAIWEYWKTHTAIPKWANEE